ncbi:MAG: hypothetical protein OER04_17970 [Cyclobacteriaceae bacterium]|nr:hypothetical protein [Cyclobacteriaceae bacterium]
MTGGAGFVKDSINSLTRNRALLKKRSKLKDHSYLQYHGIGPRGKSNYQELKSWRLSYSQRLQAWRWNISWVILVLTIITLLLGILIYS